MRIDVEGLQAFVRIAELATFREAADALSVSQPALSRRIKRLESYLGVQLFNRTTRRVTLTAVGREFLPQARRLLHELEGALATLKSRREHITRQVTLACIPTATTLLPPVIRAYSAEHPHNAVRIIDVHGNEAWQIVLRGEAEFGISAEKESGPDIAFEKLFDDPYVLACRRDHPLAKRRLVRWKDLGAHRVISVGRLSGYSTRVEFLPFNDVLRRAGNYQVEHSFDTGLMMVEAGLGVIPLPRLAMLRGVHADVIQRPLIEPELSRTIGFFWGRGEPLSTAAERFMTLLRKSVAAGTTT